MPRKRGKKVVGDNGEEPLSSQSQRPASVPAGTEAGPVGRGASGGPAQGRGGLRPEVVVGGSGSVPGAGAGRGRGGGGHGLPQPQPGAGVTVSAPHPGAGRGVEAAVAGGAASGALHAVQEAGVAEVVEGMAGLQMALVPAAQKIMKYPTRPGHGRAGIPFKVKANHFLVKVREEGSPQHYHVTITPEVVSRALNRMLIARVLELYGGEFGGRKPVYDGRSSLYSAGRLPFESKTFVVSPEDRGREGSAADAKPRKERTFNINIKFVKTVDVMQWRLFREGKTSDLPQDLIQVLDIVLRERPSVRYSAIGRSFYSPDLGAIVNLGEGLVGWRGFFQSVRPVQMGLSLNVNVTATALLGNLEVIAFLQERYRGLNERSALNDAQLRETARLLRGVKVEVTHRGTMRRKYRVFKLTDRPTAQLTFADSSSQQISVVRYFKDTYKKELRWTRLPCLDVGSAARPNYLPMEVCRILAGQRYPGRMLGERARTGLLGMTSQSPADREKDILQIVNRNEYVKDSYACEFGMQVSDKIVTVDARLLPPPTLLYGGGPPVRPVNGAWNMVGRIQFHMGGTVGRWAAVNFADNLSNDTASWFFEGLAKKCASLGMQFNPRPVGPVAGLAPRASELREFLKDYPNLDLLLVALPNIRYDWYGELKRICETEIGVMSQCCNAKHVQVGKDQYMANVAMKINVKTGGRNTVLEQALKSTLPTLGNMPTIIFGADVTHPSPGEDSVSIAAVVASQDWPHVSSYAGLISSQTGRVEMITNLQNMVKTLLLSFYARTRVQPGRLLFYRDGVSEGQFQDVLSYELTAIQKACYSLAADYRPKITFVVVQKRHHTRFFPVSGDANFCDRTGNIKAGTVVDTSVCHPTEFDFYLCSHAGLKGTSRPTHYHVLYDDNAFTSDSLQTLTNNLCSTYARCTRSVSIVPPAYYAHHLAFRARCYMGPGASEVPQPVASIRNKMFYC